MLVTVPGLTLGTNIFACSRSSFISVQEAGEQGLTAHGHGQGRRAEQAPRKHRVAGPVTKDMPAPITRLTPSPPEVQKVQQNCPVERTGWREQSWQHGASHPGRRHRRRSGGGVDSPEGPAHHTGD